LPTPVSSVQIGPSSRSGDRGSNVTMNVYPPAGTTADQIVEAGELAARRGGALPIAVTDTYGM